MATDRFWLEGGRLSLDFIGTTGARSGERLARAADLAEWLVVTRLTADPAVGSAALLEEAHALRAALGRLVRAAIGHGDIRPGDVALTNAVAARRSPHPSLSLRGRQLAVEALPLNVGECLGVIARDAIDLLGGAERDLLRRCAAEDCSGIYLDRSRGARRKWCSTAGCGNRTRVSAHRQRHHGAPPRADRQP